MGTTRRGTSGSVSQEKLALGAEEGEAAVAGGEISITKEGVDHLREAAKVAYTDIKNAIFGCSQPQSEPGK